MGCPRPTGVILDMPEEKEGRRRRRTRRRRKAAARRGDWIGRCWRSCWRGDGEDCGAQVGIGRWWRMGRAYAINGTGETRRWRRRGAGDVLTGVIASLIGQKIGAMEAAVLGVHLHESEGDFQAREKFGANLAGLVSGGYC